jgi:hypothetical protein
MLGYYVELATRSLSRNLVLTALMIAAAMAPKASARPIGI